MYPVWLFIVLYRILYKYYLASKKITSTISGPAHVSPFFRICIPSKCPKYIPIKW